MDNLDYLEMDFHAGRHLSLSGGNLYRIQHPLRCRWCRKSITWRSEGGRWVAYHRGTPHRCEKRIEADLKAAIASMPDADDMPDAEDEVDDDDV